MMSRCKRRSGTRLRRSPDSHRFYRRLFVSDCHIPECICRITRPIVFLTPNHITLLILTSCRVLAAITTVLGSASAGARGSSPFDLARQCGLHFGLMLRRWRGFPGSGSGRADVALERRLSPAEA
jgi:hypothetical protein